MAFAKHNAAPPAETSAEAKAAELRPEPRFRLRDYMVLLKVRVMSLVVFVGFAGLMMAPGAVDPLTAAAAVLCMAVGAGAAGAINMWYDRDIDETMPRTQNRPIPAGRMGAREALHIGIVLAVGSVGAMWAYVNTLAAALLALTIVYYVFIYTVWLKRRTPHNIVIGGAAGALPPLIGWAAVTGSVMPPEGWGAWILFAIIFLWTPPHSWALALFRQKDYAAANVPMLPVTAGPRAAKRQICVYTVLMLAATAAPVMIGMSGWLYGGAALALGAVFAVKTWRLWRADDEDHAPARSLFFYSILYLFLVFAALLADRWTAPFFV
ncbi:MAG: heme o synthase [Rhodospirillales bacterium]